MLQEAALLQLTQECDVLVMNMQRLPFLFTSFLNRKGSRDRQQVRHKVVVTAKRLPEMSDCCDDCMSLDPMCKCGWDEFFEVQGQWGGTLKEALTEAVARINRIGRCDTCQALTSWTSSRRCPSCTLVDLCPSTGTCQCPVCFEDVKQPHSVLLPCDHSLCRPCAQRLVHFSTDGQARCPCCRREHARSTVTAQLPPATKL